MGLRRCGAGYSTARGVRDERDRRRGRPRPARRRAPVGARARDLPRSLVPVSARQDLGDLGWKRRGEKHTSARDRRPRAAAARCDHGGGSRGQPVARARALRGAPADRHAVPARRAARFDERLRQRRAAAARAHRPRRARRGSRGRAAPDRGRAAGNRRDVSARALGWHAAARRARARHRGRPGDRALRRAVLRTRSDQCAAHREIVRNAQSPAGSHVLDHVAPHPVLAAHGRSDRVPTRRNRDRRLARRDAPSRRRARLGLLRRRARRGRPRRGRRVNPIQELGLRTVSLIAHLGRLTGFVVQIARQTVRPPWRMRRLVDEIYDVGVLSLAIVCLSGATVGAVLGLQGYVTLSRFGAEGSLGAVVGLSLVRELGPVLTALLVTGRAGSAMAAEIAAMVTTEQLDGLRMMSVDPVDYVVKPKALAMLIAMPMLNALFIVFALFGGYLVGVELLGVDGGTYVSSMEGSINFEDDIAGTLLKSVIFGALVGTIATYRGYTSEPTSAGVSAATTGTVVTA